MNFLIQGKFFIKTIEGKFLIDCHRLKRKVVECLGFELPRFYMLELELENLNFGFVNEIFLFSA
jgi:hypothetical protein